MTEMTSGYWTEKASGDWKSEAGRFIQSVGQFIIGWLTDWDQARSHQEALAAVLHTAKGPLGQFYS